MLIKAVYFVLMGMLFSFSEITMAHSLGIQGTVYPIVETDLRVTLQQKFQRMIQQGEFKKLMSSFQQAIEAHMDKPEPVSGLSRTKTPRTYFFNPSFVMPYSLRNMDGKVLIAAGTRINPLETVSLPETLIFYDGDDVVQVRWALLQKARFQLKDKLILVGGSVEKQQRLLKKPIYFDQGGQLISRFQIQHVPAMVIQQGLRLRIEEVVP